MAKQVRTLRLSEDMIQLIEQQPGENFTAKFETLVSRCIEELPKKERQLEVIQEQIGQEQSRLQKIRDKNRKIENQLLSMETAVSGWVSQIGRATNAVQSILNDA